MREERLRFAVAVVFATLLLPSRAAIARSDPAPPQAIATTEMVLVANVGSGPITAYPATSSGSVSPAFTLANPNLPNTYWGPWGVASDANGYLYVQSFLSDATMFVFAPGSRGNDPPARVFRGGGPDTRAIAVDGQGYEYIATGEGPADILVIPPAASGQSANLYSVDPVRTLSTDESVWHPWPSLLATDASNHVIAAVVRANGNALEVFEGGSAGAAAPIRVIGGTLTGLGTCGSVCNTMALTCSAWTGEIYAAVNDGAQTRVLAFSGAAAGNVAPLRSIAGPATGLAGGSVTGIAVSPLTGELYVLAKSSQFGTGQIIVFGTSAQGNAAPLRTFTDGATQLADGAGLLLAPEAVVGVPAGGVASAPTLRLQPNPARESVMARLSLAQPVASLRIEVIDVEGRVVARIWDGNAPAGVLEAPWDIRAMGGRMPAGIYLVRASGRGFQVVGRIAVIR